ncbi:MAG: septation ring formation regulator EzrA, partial [Loigolactobacillus coryniformis]|nr:septation ring formation regulator EzrA [Loigolactobacillus coryniformis]
MELILIGIIILALVLYVGVIFYQRRNSKQIDALQDREQKLTKLPFKKTMSAARQQGLAGQSQEEYAKWQERLQEIQKNCFADLERKLLLAETTNNRYRFFAAAKTIKELKQQLTT